MARNGGGVFRLQGLGALGLGFLLGCSGSAGMDRGEVNLPSAGPAPGSEPGVLAGPVENPDPIGPTPGAPARPGDEAGPGAAECDSELQLTVRDFGFHADFETYLGAMTGIVEPKLGADRKPVYAHPGPTDVTTGPLEFDQWYRDTPIVNLRFDRSIAFTRSPTGTFVYDSNAFFPIDGEGFGNGPSSTQHNFLFTTEAHTRFTYRGGETFTFRGDDDLWIFINDTLAVDLGGVHAPMEATISLDAEAGRLGIEVGQDYPMDIFHAERHTVDSNFRVETSIDLSCIENVVVPF